MAISLRRRSIKFLGWCIAAFASFVGVLLLGLSVYLLFFDYSETFRGKLEAELTRVAGAPAKIGSIHLDLTNYAFELDNITVEGSDGAPLLSVARVRGKLRLSEVVRLRLHWTELTVQGLSLRLIEGAEGGLALPRAADTTPLLKAGVAFSSDRVSLEDASIVLSNEKVPWQLEASNLAIGLTRDGVDTYRGTLVYDDGRLLIKDHPGLEASVSADFEISGGELFLHDAQASSTLGELNAKGKLGLAGGVHGRFEVSAEGEVERAAASIFGVSAAEGTVTGTMQFRGSLSVSPANKQLEGTVHWPRGRMLGISTSNWTGDVFWDRQLLQLSLAQGGIASGRARVQLHQALPVGEHTASLELDVREVSLAEIISGARKRPSPVASRVSGNASLSFDATDPRGADGSFELTGIGLDNESAAESLTFQVSGRLREGDVEIELARAETDTVTGTLSGLYPREGSAELLVDITSRDLVRMDELGVAVRRLLRPESEPDPERWGISGRGHAVGRLTERSPHFTFDGELAASELRFDRLVLRDVRGRGTLSREEMRFEDFVARPAYADSLGGSAVALSAGGVGNGAAAGVGRLWLQGPPDSRDFELGLRFSDWPAEDLSTLLDWSQKTRGLASGDIDVSRSGGALAGSASLTVSKPVFFGEPFDRASARARFRGTTVTLEDARLFRRESSLGGRVEIDIETGALAGSLATKDFPLSGSELLGLALEGRLEGEARIAGRVGAPNVDFTGRSRELGLSGVPLGDGTLSGELRGSELLLRIDQGSQLSMDATYRIGDEVLASGTIRFREVDAGPWIPLISESLPSDVHILVGGEAQFSTELARPETLTVDATLGEVAFESESFRFESLAPVQARLREGILRVPALSLVEATSRVGLGGTVNFTTRTLDLQAEGLTSLGVLESFYPSLAATGDVELSAQVTGSWERPALSGHADLKGSSLRLRGFRQALGDLRGRLVFDNRTIRIPEMHGVFGSGPVELSGAISLEGLQAGSVDLQVKGSQMRLRYPEGLVATLDADLALLGSGAEQVLSGTVTLLDALWTREYHLVSGILSDSEDFGLFEEFEGDELFENLRFDVTILAPESLRLRNSLAEIDASAELELRGSLADPVLLGSTEAERGEIFLLGHRYDITAGKVDFVDPTKVEPFVEMTAETRVRSYRVELRLTGTSDRFFPELSSDPPLRTVDILRLLSGANERDILIGTEEEEIAGVGVASLLTERLSQELGRRAERLFGLDRVSIDPFLVGQIANPTARVSLGKQVTRDLSINYSTNLNATTEAIVLIEYTPEGNMSWILSRDEEGDVGIDVKFRKSF